jgi:hypothetical protein
MAIPIVESILEVLAKALGIASPLIQDHQAKRHESDLRDRLEKYQDIMGEMDPEKRRDRIRAYVTQLCLESGFPGRQPLSGVSIEVPVEAFDSFIRGQCELIKVKGVLSDAVYAVNHKDG